MSKWGRMKEPKIRWDLRTGVFLVEFGNVRMALTPAAALTLSDALRRAVIDPGSAKAAGE